jgi:hypothetical protein
MPEEILKTLITALRLRVTRVLPQQVRDCLALLDNEQIWWRPNEESNSVGNIVLHVSGSLNHYLNRNVGNVSFSRDRAAEFAERHHIPKSELLTIFNGMVANADLTFDTVTVARLGDPSPEPKMHKLLVEDLTNIAIHLANHVGQIVWITKMLKGGAVDEVWMKAHKDNVWGKGA